MKISELDYEKLSSDNKYDLIMDGVTDDIKNLKSDVIIVLGCSPILLNDRVLKAKELYELGVSKNIVFSGRSAWQNAWKSDDNLKEKYINDINSLINYKYIDDDKNKRIYEKYASIMEEKYKEEVLSWNEKRNLDKLKLTEAKLMELFIKEVASMKNANIYSESLSDNTPENAKYSKLLLDNLVKEGKMDEYEKIIVITIAWHVRRAFLTFKKYYPDKEIIVIPSTNDLKRNNISLDKDSFYSYYPNTIDSECKKLIKYSNNNSIEDVFLDYFLPKEKANEIELSQKIEEKNIFSK